MLYIAIGWWDLYVVDGLVIKVAVLFKAQMSAQCGYGFWAQGG